MTPLLKEIETFMKARGIPPATFGREAVKDPRFVFQLRQGRDIRQSTAERVRKYMLTGEAA